MPLTKVGSLYSPHPSLWMVEKWKNELRAKTGRSLDEWIAFVKQAGPPTEKERREWLKKEHKLGTNSAACIAERAEGKGIGGRLARSLPRGGGAVDRSDVRGSARGAASPV